MLKVNQLVGFGSGSGAGGGITAVPVHDTSFGAGNATLPSDVADGDIGILIQGGYQEPPFTTPSGWTSAGTYQYSIYQGASVVWRKLTTADQSASVTTIAGSSSAYDVHRLLVFRPDADIGTITSFGWSAGGTTSNVTQNQNLTSSSGYDRLFIGFFYAVSATVQTLSCTNITVEGTYNVQVGSGRLIAQHKFCPADADQVTSAVSTAASGIFNVVGTLVLRFNS